MTEAATANLAKAIFLQALYQHPDFTGVSRAVFTWRAAHLIWNWKAQTLRKEV